MNTLDILIFLFALPALLLLAGAVVNMKYRNKHRSQALGRATQREIFFVPGDPISADINDED